MKVAEFLQHEGSGGSFDYGQMSSVGTPSSLVVDAVMWRGKNTEIRQQKEAGFPGIGAREQVRELVKARESGVAYMMGHMSIVASESSSFVKKFVIDIVYGSLRRNCRHPAVSLGIPHTSLIEVGMVYHV